MRGRSPTLIARPRGICKSHVIVSCLHGFVRGFPGLEEAHPFWSSGFRPFRRIHQRRNLFTGKRFLEPEGLRDADHGLAVLAEELLRTLVALIHDRPDLLVNPQCKSFAVAPRAGHLAPQEESLLALGIAYGSKIPGHPPLGDHAPSELRGSLYVVGGAGGDFVAENLLPNPPGYQDHPVSQ